MISYILKFTGTILALQKEISSLRSKVTLLESVCEERSTSASDVARRSLTGRFSGHNMTTTSSLPLAFLASPNASGFDVSCSYGLLSFTFVE